MRLICYCARERRIDGHVQCAHNLFTEQTIYILISPTYTMHKLSNRFVCAMWKMYSFQSLVYRCISTNRVIFVAFNSHSRTSRCGLWFFSPRFFSVKLLSYLRKNRSFSSCMTYCLRFHCFHDRQIKAFTSPNTTGKAFQFNQMNRITYTTFFIFFCQSLHFFCRFIVFCLQIN